MSIQTRPVALADDGTFPNSPLPAVHYIAALSPGGAVAFEALFRGNGWGRCWRNGVYAFHHYHSTAHEVLGVAAGRAEVQLGGPAGPVVDIKQGDAVFIPAGVAHSRVSASPDFLVVGAYPAGQAPDLCRGTREERPAADQRMAAVLLPSQDPVLGDAGPALPPFR